MNKCKEGTFKSRDSYQKLGKCVIWVGQCKKTLIGNNKYVSNNL